MTHINKTYFFLAIFTIVASCRREDFTSSDAQDFTELLTTLQEAELGEKESLLVDVENAFKREKNLPDSITAQYHFLKGDFFTKKGVRDSAIMHYQKSINTVSKGPLSEQQVSYFYNTWNAYFDREEYGECIAINRRYKTLLSKNNDARLTSIAHSLDKAVYLKTKAFEKALESSSEQIKYLKRTNDTNAIVSALISRTKILDDVYKDRKPVFKLLDSLTAYSADYTNGINRMLFGQYGVHLFLEDRFPEAISYFQKGVNYAKEIEHLPTRKKRLSNLYNNLAEASLEVGKYDEARAYLDSISSLDITSLETRQQRAFLRNTFRLTASTSSETKPILLILDSLNSFQNKTYQEKYSKDLAALKIANAKEERLQRKKSEADFKNFRLRLYLIIGSVLALFLGLIGWLFYRSKKNTLEKENLLTQQRLLRAQMNPHFTFNTLTVIQGMIDENPSEAKNYLLKFSRLLASIFENSTFNYVLLSKEIEALRQYMDLQRMRFSDGLEYHINLGSIEDDLLYVPSMLFQPIVENSINHGFAGISHKGVIHITLEETNGLIHCTIEDNGKGILTAANPSTRKSSTKLIKNFLEKTTNTPFRIVNKKEKSEHETGVIVTFAIPFKESIND